MTMDTQPKKTASGLDTNVAAALTDALGWVTGLVFFLTEPENREVRFHAMQSIVVFGATLSTTHVQPAGDGSTFWAASFALTWNV